MSRRRFVTLLAGSAAGLLVGAQRRALPAAAWGTGQDWANYASQFNGYPYVYGGNQPSGWDCSGFTQYVAAHFGVYVDHGTATQYYEGTPVANADIQAGDFLYFQNTFNSGISHVGVVTNPGGTTMISALNASAGTVFSNYSTTYWQGHWFGAARFWSAGAPPPSSCSSSGTSATTTASLNLRTGPSTSYAVVDVIPSGASVVITGAGQNGFDPVTYGGECGWASAGYLSAGGTPAPTGGTQLRTTANVNVRSGPNTTYSSLGIIASGTLVTWDGSQQSGGGYVWDECSTPVGTGWIANAYLTTA